jgi:hypothetical protein
LPSTGGPATLAFEEIGTPDSRNTFLDDVGVVKE